MRFPTSTEFDPTASMRHKPTRDEVEFTIIGSVLVVPVAFWMMRAMFGLVTAPFGSSARRLLDFGRVIASFGLCATL
jgi:hypothetical protein